MAFSPCLPRKRPSLQAAQDNGRPLPNRLFHLPDAEKAISLCSESSDRPWGTTQPAPETHFPTCLSKKSLPRSARDRLSPPACRGKGRIMDLVCACDGLTPCLSRKRPSHGLGVRSRWPLSPVCRRKIRFRAPRHPPERPRKIPKSGPVAPGPKNSIFGLDLLFKQC